MTDFFQNGNITTLHNLSNRSIPDLEKELVQFSHFRPMSLLLPSLFSELEGPALMKIVDELAKVPYLSEIVIGLDRADEQQYRFALNYFDPTRNDGFFHPNHRILNKHAPLISP